MGQSRGAGTEVQYRTAVRMVQVPALALDQRYPMEAVLFRLMGLGIDRLDSPTRAFAPATALRVCGGIFWLTMIRNGLYLATTRFLDGVEAYNRHVMVLRDGTMRG